MELSHALTNHLTLLSDALGDEVSHLKPLLLRLVPDLTRCLTYTIPGYLGLTITVLVDGVPLIISTLPEDATTDVGGSLLLTLLPVGTAATTGTVTFYSDGTGAFFDLAESARWIFNLDCGPRVDTFTSIA